MKIFSKQLSLSKQFLLIGFPILMAGTLFVGSWIGQQVEDSVVHRIGGVTSLYVDSFVAPHVQTLNTATELSQSDHASIAADLANTQLGQKIVSLKIWRKDGYVLFSNDGHSTGHKFPIDEGLEVALTGNIFSEISERTSAQRAEHGQPYPRLIETYTPIHADRTGAILAAAEFYQLPDEVDREVGVAKQRSWLLVAGTSAMMYLLLFFLVHKGSRTIENQQFELGDKIKQLTWLNEQNRKLHARIIRAAEDATALNEVFLQRISANIHDGPGQDLGYALMQLKNIKDGCEYDANQPQTAVLNKVEPALLAVQSALADLRAISSDLELPDIKELNPAEIAARVLRDFHAKTGLCVPLKTTLPGIVSSFRVKVTLYRLLQESLANAFRHAQCKNCKIALSGDFQYLIVEISDEGAGFDPVMAVKKGRLGLQGMRQRVEVLGGTFEIRSVMGSGTLIRATLPLKTREPEDE